MSASDLAAPAHGAYEADGLTPDSEALARYAAEYWSRWSSLRAYVASSTPETYSWDAHVDAALGPVGGPERALFADVGIAGSWYRRLVTSLDPFLFAVTYVPELVTWGGRFTVAAMHLDLWGLFVGWVLADRQRATDGSGPHDAFLAPRYWGKSAWLLKVLVLWVAAHGHLRVQRRSEVVELRGGEVVPLSPFVMVLSNSAEQIENLSSFLVSSTDPRRSGLVRVDYPGLVESAPVFGFNASIASANGFRLTTATLGRGSSTRGVNDDRNRRPDLIIVDDPEVGDGSVASMYHRDRELRFGVWQTNRSARKVTLGTTTMHGGLMHQILSRIRGGIETPDHARSINPHHYGPIETVDGAERSTWPSRWSIEALRELRSEDSAVWAMEYLNDPMALSGKLWVPGSFHHRFESAATSYPWTEAVATWVVIDPKVTTGAKADSCGIVVVEWNGFEARGGERPGRVNVLRAEAVDLVGLDLRAHLVDVVLPLYPDVSAVIVEVNQGGPVLWGEALHDLPILSGPSGPLDFVHQTRPKDQRIRLAYAQYEAGRVTHEHPLAVESELTAWPAITKVDTVDALATAVLYALAPDKLAAKTDYVTGVSGHDAGSFPGRRVA